jgi:hypothetical protein
MILPIASNLSDCDPRAYFICQRPLAKDQKMFRFVRFIVMFAAILVSQAQAQGAFNKNLTHQGMNFDVTCANQGSENTLRIAPSGSGDAPRVIEQNIDGTVVGAEIADLDGNGAPEIYVFVQSAGSGSYGAVVGHVINAGAPTSAITMPELTDDSKASAGYMGRDRFSIARDRLVRQFPIYREGDSNASPSGGTRQVQYRLVRRDATWALQLVAEETKEAR